MKPLLLTTVLTITTILVTYGQGIRFNENYPPGSTFIADFLNRENVIIEKADFNTDGHIDILVLSEGSQAISIYFNDGLGNFKSLDAIHFGAISNPELSIADINNDGFLDVTLFGSLGGSLACKIYLSDNGISFNSISTSPIIPVTNGKSIYADLDNDGNMDLITTGQININVTTLIYFGNGNGQFVQGSNNQLAGVLNGNLEVADIDNDGDQDILINGNPTAANLSGPFISKLYLNDGSANFAESSTFSVNPTIQGTITLFDSDNDNDSDLLITGKIANGNIITELYSNDGQGDFSPTFGSNFLPIFLNSTDYEDFDSDGDLDLIFTGFSYGIKSTILYNNDSGNFSEVSSTGLSNIANGDAVLVDSDDDGMSEVLLIGETSTNSIVSEFYKNDGTNSFIEQKLSYFEGTQLGALEFVDFNSDGNLDVYLTALNDSGSKCYKGYIGDGAMGFTPSNSEIGYLGQGDLKFEDFDGDGDQDALVSGSTTIQLTNDGNGNFTAVDSTTFIGVQNSKISISDIDNDSDFDVLLVGHSDSGAVIQLYQNDGSGNFSEVTTPQLTALDLGNSLFFDANNDGSIDLLSTGLNQVVPSTILYLNNGLGNFIEQTSTNFINVGYSSSNSNDVDLDGDLDLLISGYDENSNRSTILYLNDGAGNFVSAINDDFDNVEQGTIEFLDADQDGDADVMVSGLGNFGFSPVIFYRNDSQGNFSKVIGTNLENTYTSYSAIGDLNNDGVDEIMTINQSLNQNNRAHLYATSSCNYTTGTHVVEQCDEFTWINGVTYTTSNYDAQFVLPNSSGCDSLVNLDLTINGVSVAPYGASYDISANAPGATSFQWISCLDSTEIIGATDANFYPSNQDFYAVIVSNGVCTDTSYCVSLNGISNLEENKNDISNIFPNPTKNNFQITTDLPIDNIQIFSTTGELILETTQKEISLANTSKGIYIIKLLSEGNVYTQRIVKN